jgi:hypothetical protein
MFEPPGGNNPTSYIIVLLKKLCCCSSSLVVPLPSFYIQGDKVTRKILGSITIIVKNKTSSLVFHNYKN